VSVEVIVSTTVLFYNCGVRDIRLTLITEKVEAAMMRRLRQTDRQTNAVPLTIAKGTRRRQPTKKNRTVNCDTSKCANPKPKGSARRADGMEDERTDDVAVLEWTRVRNQLSIWREADKAGSLGPLPR
jgi:hypothetical protein